MACGVGHCAVGMAVGVGVDSTAGGGEGDTAIVGSIVDVTVTVFEIGARDGVGILS